MKHLLKAVHLSKGSFSEGVPFLYLNNNTKLASFQRSIFHESMRLK